MPAKPNVKELPWGTERELEFISGLGTFYEPKSREPMPSKVVMLENYLKAALLRTNWDDIDRGAVILHATTLLERERKAVARLSGEQYELAA